MYPPLLYMYIFSLESRHVMSNIIFSSVRSIQLPMIIQISGLCDFVMCRVPKKSYQHKYHMHVYNIFF